jgi:hypothetical protein
MVAVLNIDGVQESIKRAIVTVKKVLKTKKKYASLLNFLLNRLHLN